MYARSEGDRNVALDMVRSEGVLAGCCYRFAMMSKVRRIPEFKVPDVDRKIAPKLGARAGVRFRVSDWEVRATDLPLMNCLA